MSRLFANNTYLLNKQFSKKEIDNSNYHFREQVSLCFLLPIRTTFITRRTFRGRGGGEEGTQSLKGIIFSIKFFYIKIK